MRQLVQEATGTILVRDVAQPECHPWNVLVRNEFSAISSGTERSVLEASRKSLLRKVQDRPELALKALESVRREGIRSTANRARGTGQESPTGYSCAGVVVEVGTSVRGISVGDRVACAGAGHASHAELVSVPGNLCARVPPEVPMDVAALTTIASIALHGVRLASSGLGERVAVIGCGLVGQIACRLLLAAGCTVVALDVDPGRIQQAKEAGADAGFPVSDAVAEQVLEWTGGIGVDASIVTAASSSSAPLKLAADCARDRGVIVLVGDVPIEFSRPSLFGKELSFRISRSYGPGRYDTEYEERGLDYPIGYVRWTEKRNMECILDLQARGKLDLRNLVDEVVSLEQAAYAYERLAGPPESRPRGTILFRYAQGADTPAPAAATSVPARVHEVKDGTVGVGLIGPGGFARSVLVPAFARAGARLVTVSGGGGLSAGTAARELGFERISATVEEVLAEPEVDAVVVATRHGTHAAVTQAALSAGKHVYCEKPLALNAHELDGALEAATEHHRVLAVGFNRRYSPLMTRMVEFIADSQEPCAIVYRVSAGSLPADHWINDLDQGGGRLIGEACHFIDILRLLAASEITSVNAAGFGALDRPIQTQDNVSVTVRFANGSVGTLVYVSAGSAGIAKERLEVFAGRRTAVLDDFVSLQLHAGEKPEVVRLRAQDKGHRECVRRFLECVRQGSLPMDLETVREVHLACFAAVEALRTGAVVLPATVASVS